ncbi:MAG: hydratase [Clostridiales bacterium]|nr:hydratase [Clostridiales bacterium]
MLTILDERTVYRQGALCREAEAPRPPAGEGEPRSIAQKILAAHDAGGGDGLLHLSFDLLTSHDITYVGIIQSARASGLSAFPVPYVLTNCHNSLCAVGGTINEDDHVFGLSAAQRYGGIYVPAHLAVMHQYMRETRAGCGRMILGSDSHTRYGALGTMGIGEGGPELVKQLLGRKYDIAPPPVVAVWLEGSPPPGVGPQDVALALIGAVFASGFVKNKVLEFLGPGLKNLSADFRCGIDVMTTETACLSSIWQTDGVIEAYLAAHGRAQDYRALAPDEGAVYDGAILLDLSKVEPMIALPCHPSNVYPLRALCENPYDLLREAERRVEADSDGTLRLNLTDKLREGRLIADQGIIAGCAGGSYENLCAAAAQLRGRSVGSGFFSLSLYPASQPIGMALIESGAHAQLSAAGALFKTAFCGPCFGAGDVPANGGLSLRHTTRNFPFREGARPADGQAAAVALMDARSIAATAANGGLLTPAGEAPAGTAPYRFDDRAYRSRVYEGFGHPRPQVALRMGPGITDWPELPPLRDHLLLSVVSVITDPVTTTDELIPSGETSSYRSNPQKLAEFTLSRKDPGYVARARAVLAQAERLLAGEVPALLREAQAQAEGLTLGNTLIGSAVAARCPGDGSAREQAASCQRVLGGLANLAEQYATKRYRSNLINWGLLPLLVPSVSDVAQGDLLLIRGLRAGLARGDARLEALWLREGRAPAPLALELGPLTAEERDILLAGGLINHFKAVPAQLL